MKFELSGRTTSKSPLRIIPIFANSATDILLTKFGLDIHSSVFSGKKDSTYLLQHHDQLVLLIGLGEDPEMNEVEKSFRRVLPKNSEIIQDKVTLDFSQDLDSKLIESALIGFSLGGYSFDFFKKEKDKKKDFQDLKVEINSNNESIQQIIDRAEKIANAKIEAFKLVDLPPNVLTPTFLAEWAIKLEGKNGLKAIIFDKKKAKSERLEAFLAVSRGSAKEPKFIILEHRHPQAKFHLGLVGKGVTFDTGGLNIKTQGMVHMKSDMGGAAAVLATTQLIVDLNLPINLTSIVPAVENAVDKDAYLPSEVIQSHAGLSIEVIDTDAEGRLILADGLSYLVQNYAPDQVIDLATLTGSSVATFGYECGALFSNSEVLSKNLQKAGLETSEKVWSLPMWENYRKEMDSEIADIKNYHGKPIAGAITAAKFLEAFIHEHPSWAHLDIAGVAYGDTEFSKTKSGTAFGVQLLLKFIENQL
jgi:leucyl aminopeptidase